MGVFKCKMCGGNLEIQDGMSVCECEYCGSKQTVPTADNEKKMTLFTRASRLLRNCEFDKASGVFENIVTEFPEEAEAYWGLVLCKYGIEYVDDPKTGKKIPTCHRSSFDSVLDDSNYEQACENTDAIARRVYRDEARAIEELRKNIIEVSGKEEPYDVFISYKETDENGARTLDSVIAQDIYKELTDEGYRVFFSRISLESKLGIEYEPYIFAALNSAKVMIVVGTDYENFDAVWVKNEWSRFLRLIASGQKKTLVPVFKNMDAYDMPKEFAKLSAQDMGKVGAMQDLIRGINKLLGGKQSSSLLGSVTTPSTTAFANPTVASLLERAFMFASDGNFEKAEQYAEKVLDIEPQNAQAYLCKLISSLKVTRKECLAQSNEPFDGKPAYQKICQFGDPVLTAEVSAYNETVKARLKIIEEKKRAEEENEQQRKRKEQEENAERLKPIRQQYETVSGLLLAGLRCTVGLRTDGTVVAVGEKKDGKCDVSGWTDVVAISVGSFHTVGLRADGTVVATGQFAPCNAARRWRDIVAVDAGGDYTIGLHADGTAVIAGGHRLASKWLDVSGWTDVVAVATGYEEVYGLRKDGTVVSGRTISVLNGWTDIVAITAGTIHCVGLRADGTVVAAGVNGFGECDVDGWTDVVAISVGTSYTVGLRADGTVVAVGANHDGECDVGGWRDIVAVDAGGEHTVGLRADGTVVAVGANYDGKCDVDGWTDVVAISAGANHTVGLRADGTVVAVGANHNGECDVSKWKLFNSIDSLEEERKAAQAERKAAEAERQAELSTQKKKKETLQAELANLHGLFTGKRRKEIETHLNEIEKKLKKMS